MSDKTLGQIEKKLPVSKDTFKRWEKDGTIPKARRKMKGKTATRTFSEEEVNSYIDLIKDVQDGKVFHFDKKRDEKWSPFPLPNGSKV